ncbi:hypothetical protein G9P44_003759 [Scheffersomyces stipitis]|nr:hypothetical protein G9P44_003759 [Scheffersomyces stipitis]
MASASAMVRSETSSDIELTGTGEEETLSGRDTEIDRIGRDTVDWVTGISVNEAKGNNRWLT